MTVFSLDPRSKLIAALTATIGLISFDHWQELMIALSVLLIILLAARLGRPWVRWMKGLGFAVGSFFVIAWISFDLLTGMIASLRLLAISTVFFLFFQTTSPETLSNALIKMGVPYSFTFVLTSSIQFIHVLSRRASGIRDAQRARGIPLDKGFQTLFHLPALAGPLLIQAFKLADELAEAMEARGFGAPHRQFRHEPRFKSGDWVIVGMSVVSFIIILL